LTGAASGGTSPAMQKSFELHGHRGARALFPENTLPGFIATMALGVDGLELDIATTSDGVPVIFHDPDLHPDLVRLPDGTWLDGDRPLIRSIPLAALRCYDVGRIRPGSPTALNFPNQVPRDGTHIPTFAELVAATMGSKVTIQAELKLQPPRPEATVAASVMAEAVIAVVAAAGALDRLDLRSFDWLALRYVHLHHPAIPLTYLTRRPRPALAPFYWDGDMTAPVPASVAAESHGRPAVWAPEYMTLTEPLLADAHALGLRVMPWTVNDPADMARLIGWGVDGICTDRPDLARIAMQAAGLALPVPFSA
jgi:glycerophosphoryl diester phosphodiesterase